MAKGGFIAASPSAGPGLGMLGAKELGTVAPSSQSLVVGASVGRPLRGHK